MELFGKYGLEFRNSGNSNIVSNSIPYFFGIFGNRKLRKSEMSYLVSTSEKIGSDFGNFESSELLNTPNCDNPFFATSIRK